MRNARRGWVTRLALVALGTLWIAACGGEPPQDGQEYRPFVNTCRDGTLPARTNDWVYARSTQYTNSAQKTLLRPDSELCVELGPAGDPVTVTGSTYSVYDGNTVVGSNNAWYRVVWGSGSRYVAVAYVELLQEAAGGAQRVLYIQALSDPTLSRLMEARDDVEVAISEPAKRSLEEMSWNVQDQVFLQYINEAITRIEGEADSIAVVISGHSAGPSLWGTYGTIGHEDLRQLALSHPEFAAKVRHVYLLGCNTGWRPTMDQWRLPFANLVSVAGFAGKGPGGVPAYRYFDQSYEVTRNLGSSVASPDSVLHQLRTQEQAIYTNWGFMVLSDGVSYYAARKNASLYTARQAYESSSESYREGWLAADSADHADPPADHNSEIIDGQFTPRKHYNDVQSYRNALVQALSGETDEYLWYNEDQALVDRLEDEMDQAIRLVFYRMCKAAWLEDNQQALDSWLQRADIADMIRDAHNGAISSLNSATHTLTSGAVSRAHIAAMTRMEANDFVGLLEQIQAAAMPADARAMVDRFDSALVDLDSAELPASYIE